MNALLKRALAPLCIPLSALSLMACGTTVSTAAFQGEEREAAQALSTLQTDATAGDQKKICKSDLAAALVASLAAGERRSGSAAASDLAGCEQAIKNQLTEVDRFELSVQAVTLGSAAGHPTATARVKSLYSGKTRRGTVQLVKEGKTWKVAALG